MYPTPYSVPIQPGLNMPSAVPSGSMYGRRFNTSSTFAGVTDPTHNGAPAQEYRAKSRKTRNGCRYTYDIFNQPMEHLNNKEYTGEYTNPQTGVTYALYEDAVQDPQYNVAPIADHIGSNRLLETYTGGVYGEQWQQALGVPEFRTDENLLDPPTMNIDPRISEPWERFMDRSRQKEYALMSLGTQLNEHPDGDTQGFRDDMGNFDGYVGFHQVTRHYGEQPYIDPVALDDTGFKPAGVYIPTDPAFIVPKPLLSSNPFKTQIKDRVRYNEYHMNPVRPASKVLKHHLKASSTIPTRKVVETRTNYIKPQAPPVYMHKKAFSTIPTRKIIETRTNYIKPQAPPVYMHKKACTSIVNRPHAALTTSSGLQADGFRTLNEFPNIMAGEGYTVPPDLYTSVVPVSLMMKHSQQFYGTDKFAATSHIPPEQGTVRIPTSRSTHHRLVYRDTHRSKPHYKRPNIHIQSGTQKWDAHVQPSMKRLDPDWLLQPDKIHPGRLGGGTFLFPYEPRRGLDPVPPDLGKIRIRHASNPSRITQTTSHGGLQTLSRALYQQDTAIAPYPLHHTVRTMPPVHDTSHQFKPSEQLVTCDTDDPGLANWNPILHTK